jgi:sporulation protein YlmC with PRC-barrel domain
MTQIDDPFADWKRLLNKSVYSIDGKKIGFLREVVADYMVVRKGFISLTKYFIPTSLAESVSKKGIRIRVTAVEAKTKYSSTHMKNFVNDFESLHEGEIKNRIIVDRLQVIRYGTTRNRLAAGIAFISGILFLISGYQANLAIYDLIGEQIRLHAGQEIWQFVVTPIGFLAFFSQLGGFAVLMGAGLFAANRVNWGKFFVMLGTGQGLVTILLHIILRVLSSSGWNNIDNDYIIWLGTSLAGVGTLFAIASQSVSKGKGEGINLKVLRFILHREVKNNLK